MDDPKLPKKSTFCRLGTLYWAENDNIFSFFVLFSFLSALYWAADDPKTHKKMFFLSFFGAHMAWGNEKYSKTHCKNDVYKKMKNSNFECSCSLGKF